MYKYNEARKIVEQIPSDIEDTSFLSIYFYSASLLYSWFGEYDLAVMKQLKQLIYLINRKMKSDYFIFYFIKLFYIQLVRILPVLSKFIKIC